MATCAMCSALHVDDQLLHNVPLVCLWECLLNYNCEVD
jgi:hypothetical protein